MANLATMFLKDRPDVFRQSTDRMIGEDVRNNAVADQFRMTAHEQMLELSAKPTTPTRRISAAHQRDFKTFIQKTEALVSACDKNMGGLRAAVAQDFNREAMTTHAEPTFRLCAKASAALSKVSPPKSLSSAVREALEGWAGYMSEKARFQSEQGRAAGFFVTEGSHGREAYRYNEIGENGKRQRGQDYLLEAHRLAGMPY